MVQALQNPWPMTSLSSSPWRIIGGLLLGAALLSSPAAEAFSVKSIKLTEVSSDKSLENEQYYFNQARCQCGTQIKLTLELSDVSDGQYKDLQVRSGTSSCYNETTKEFSSSCDVVVPQTVIQGLPAYYYVTVDANKLMGTSCSGQNNESRYILVYANTSADSSIWTKITEKAFKLDTQPPKSVTSAKVASGEGLVTVSFTGVGSTSTSTSDAGSTTKEVDIKGYQVLCRKVTASGYEPGKSSPPDPGFVHSQNLCSKCTSGSSTSTSDAGAVGYAGFGPYALEAGVPPQDGAAHDGAATDGVVKDSGVSDGKPADQNITAKEASTAKDSGVHDSSATSAGAITCLEQAYVCSAISSQSANTIDVEELQNDQKYEFYVVAIDMYGNPSTPTLAGSTSPQLAEDLWERYKRAGGQSDGGYCFVATAAYGSYDHPQVRILRAFRDQVLAHSSWGRRFISTYYQMSPGPAGWLARHDRARPLARLALWPITLAAAAHLFTSPLQKGLILVSYLLLVAVFWTRRRHRRGLASCGSVADNQE
jgi:hypothetical protein